MKLDERLTDLQNHPEDEQLKHSIREKLDMGDKRKQWNWLGSRFGEVSFGLLILFLGSFLLYTSMQPTHQASSESIQAIYSYKSKDADVAFRAKPSVNYIGMENVTTENLVLLFETLNELPEISPQTKNYGDYELVVVYENGEQRRFELDASYLYDVDEDVYYPGYNQMSAKIDSDLYEAHNENKLPIYLMTPLIFLLIGGIALFYSRRKIELPKPSKSRYVVLVSYTLTILGIFLYAYNNGLLYFPYLLLVIFALAYMMWWSIKRDVTNPVILKVEKFRMIALVVIVVVFLLWG